MKKMLVSVLLAAVIAAPGCGPPGDVPAQEEAVIDETIVEEDVAAAPEEVAEEEPADGEPGVVEVVEEIQVTEEEEQEPVEEVPIPKAEFKGSNLQIVQNADIGNDSYTITVDVQNTGDLKGEYKFTPRLDVEYFEEIKVSLSPGQKKTITLTEVQEYVGSLARSYNTGTTSKRTYYITAAGCRETLEFPLAEDVLQLISTYGVKYTDGYVELTGEVKNISEDTLEDVELVVRNYDENGKLIKEESALIKRNPLPPGNSSALYIVYLLPETKRYGVYFRFKDGDRIRTDYGEYEVYRPPEY